VDISFAERVFTLILSHNMEVVDEEVNGKDELWTILIPFGRGKSPFALAQGEQTVCVPLEREKMEKNGRKRTITYRIVRIR
jgi:hypothetical protein